MIRILTDQSWLCTSEMYTREQGKVIHIVRMVPIAKTVTKCKHGYIWKVVSKCGNCGKCKMVTKCEDALCIEIIFLTLY